MRRKRLYYQFSAKPSNMRCNTNVIEWLETNLNLLKVLFVKLTSALTASKYGEATTNEVPQSTTTFDSLHCFANNPSCGTSYLDPVMKLLLLLQVTV